MEWTVRLRYLFTDETHDLATTRAEVLAPPVRRQGNDRRELHLAGRGRASEQGCGCQTADVRPLASAAALVDRANLTGLVLGCIEANICKQICV